MDLTYALLDHQLRQKYPTEHIGVWNSQKKISRIMLWDGRCHGQDTLYLYDVANHGGRLPSVPRSDILFLIPEQDWPLYEQEKGWSLLYTDSIQAVNDTLQACTDFQTWTSQILILSKVEHNYSKMMELSCSYLKMSFMIIDSDYKIAACHSYDAVPFWRDGIASGKMDTQEIQTLYLDCPDFDKTFSKNGLTYYPYTTLDGHKIYYYNIDYPGGYLARLIIAVPSGQDTQETFILLEYLSEHLSTCYRHCYEHRSKRSSSERIYSYLRKLLQGSQVDRPDAIQTFQSIGWLPAHTYQVLRLISEGHINSTQTLGYFCFQIEEQFPAIRAIEMDSGIFCVYDLSMDKNLDRFQEDLPIFLRDDLFKAGMSDRFSDIFNCYLYGRQAADALRIGSQTDPDLWRYDFSAYSMSYIFQKSTEDYPAQELYHPAIRILEKYDASHPGTELLATLRQYFLCGQNASKAADAMHIHRTTFLYRMKKIQQLTPLRPDDPEDILHLMFSFALLSHQ